jgi:hypothetical protein
VTEEAPAVLDPGFAADGIGRGRSAERGAPLELVAEQVASGVHKSGRSVAITLPDFKRCADDGNREKDHGGETSDGSRFHAPALSCR